MKRVQIIITTIRVLIIVSLLSFESNAQIDFKDFVVTEKFIWALTTTGQIKLFDKAGSQIDKRIINSSEILFIAKDKLKNPIIIDSENKIKRYKESDDSWAIISKYKDNCFGVVFNSKNECYLITDKGIKDLQTQKTYFSKESLNEQITYKDKWGKPYCYFMDRNDKIWIGFGYGEWGGNLFVFETKNKKFEKVELDSFQISLWPVKSFFEDSSSVYLSTGLQHMMTSGAIVRFDNLKASFLFKSDYGGEYIGPAIYNENTNTIYFYSQNGIFKGEKKSDLSKIENWKVILKPKLNWKYGQPDAVGSPMNVLKIATLENNGLIFLSQNDGIGYFDGAELKMLK